MATMLNQERERVPAGELHLCSWCDEVATCLLGTVDRCCGADWTRWFGGWLADGQVA